MFTPLLLTSPSWVLPIYKKVYVMILVFILVCCDSLFLISFYTVIQNFANISFFLYLRWRRSPLEISHHLFFLLWYSVNYLILSIQFLSSLGLLFKVFRKYTKRECITMQVRIPVATFVFCLNRKLDISVFRFFKSQFQFNYSEHEWIIGSLSSLRKS